MSINLFHNLNTIKTTSASLPLTLDAPLGVVLPSNASSSTNPSASKAGMMYFDTGDKFLKYHNGTTWVIIGSTDGINNKATKLNAADIGGPGYGDGKYLSSDNSGTTEWRDPAKDGFLAFNKTDSSGHFQTFTLNNNFLFTGANKFSQAVDMQNNVISNVVQSADQDAVPKKYVDTIINQKVHDLNISYADRVKQVEALFNDLVHKILTTPIPDQPAPVVPPPPPPPNPVRAYLIETGNVVNQYTSSIDPNPANFANDAHQKAIAQNGGRIPAAGSVYVYTYYTVTWTIGSKRGAASSKKTTFVKFTWNGSQVIMNYYT